MIIATRSLTLRKPEGDVEIPIRMFAPEKDGGAWKCLFEIDWPEGRLERYAMGEDAFQALHLSLEMIGIILYTSEHHEAGNLFFRGWNGGYGFPVVRTVRDLLIGDDAKYL
jgi:hypothetical protein